MGLDGGVFSYRHIQARFMEGLFAVPSQMLLFFLFLRLVMDMISFAWFFLFLSF